MGLGHRISAGHSRPWTGEIRTRIVDDVPARSTAAVSSRGRAMTTRIRACSLIAAGVFAVSGLALAQEPYPDLKGTWVGPGRSVTQGKTDQWPQAGDPGPVFREGSWTVVVDRQEGNLLAGTQGLTEGTRRDPLLG
jgi:hypothetical protein